jgi:hypothetical protein
MRAPRSPNTLLQARYVTAQQAVERLLRPQGVLLGELIRLHVGVNDPHLLDASWGYGLVWRRSSFYPTARLDIRNLPGVTHEASWLELPRLFATGAFDAAIWDPIHVPDASATSARYARYVADQAPVRGESVLPFVEPFLVAVRPILDASSGTLIVKLKDINHAGRVQWQVRRLLEVAERLGWLACDEDLSLGTLTDDPKWQVQHLTPKCWCSWLVLHTAPHCPGHGIPRPRARRCANPECRLPFRGRADALTCSDACRQRRHRARGRATGTP